MKIIFQDIDYVLNSHKFEISRDIKNEPYIPYYSEIDPDCISRLNKILSIDTEIKIVISSDWRSDLSLMEFKKLFSHFNINPDRVIDKTSSNVNKKKSIELWIKENNPSNFIILDDDRIFGMEEPLYNNFYKVKSSALDDNDVEQITKIINDWK